jgi:hypothetical protein
LGGQGALGVELTIEAAGGRVELHAAVYSAEAGRGCAALSLTPLPDWEHHRLARAL